jgi:hypothetical protein
MSDEKRVFEVLRRWRVDALTPADAVSAAKPGEHIDVIIHRVEDDGVSRPLDHWPVDPCSL